MKKTDLFVSAASILFGLLIIYLSSNMQLIDQYGIPADRFWPLIIAGLFIFLGVLQGLVALKQASKETPDLSSMPVRKAYLCGAAGVMFGGVTALTGFIPAALLFIPSLMALMGERRKWVLVAFPILSLLVVYVVFVVLFQSTLPESIFSE